MDTPPFKGLNRSLITKGLRLECLASLINSASLNRSLITKGLRPLIPCALHHLRKFESFPDY